MILIRCNDDTKDNGRIYFISQDGKRHWVSSSHIVSTYDNMDMIDIKDIPYDSIVKYPLSFALAPNCNGTNKDSIQRHHIWDRNWFGSSFRGEGLEFSAASSPWPCHISCHVEYTDPFGEDEGCKVGYENKDYVPLDYHASMEDMSTIHKEYDFICSSHVIEHTPRPILAIKNIYDHLKKGGVYVMAVPHMRYTFDMLRELTPLQHHIDDYNNYSRDRDVIHVVDHFEKAHCKHSGLEADISALCKGFLDGQTFDIHYHTFTEDSMMELLQWINENVCKWSRIEVFDRVEGQIEFFVRMQK